MSRKLELRVTCGAHAGSVFEFDERSAYLVVGSDESAQLSLADDPAVSRFHCRFELAAPHCRVVDLASRSGTFVNGKQVDECDIVHEDQVQVGDTEILVSLLPETDESAGSTRFADNDRIAATVIMSSKPAIPGYDLHEVIGTGALGQVYRAVKLATQQEVAIKIVRPDRAASQEHLQIFVREISVLSQLDHPRIVRYHECGCANEQMFFVMDLVPAVDFHEAMQDQSAVARSRVPCGLICHVLEALQYAHERHLVHRDVKPENVLITRTGHRLKALLADFGLAKNFEIAGLSGITPSGTIRGTIPYMAPEQLMDARQARPPCDVYSAGATLYYYLTGSPPFDGDSMPHLLRSVIEDAPPEVRELAPDVPIELAEVVKRAMAKLPENRFRTAEDFQQALDQFTKRDAYS